jgi:hypothetical protein
MKFKLLIVLILLFTLIVGCTPIEPQKKTTTPPILKETPAPEKNVETSKVSEKTNENNKKTSEIKVEEILTLDLKCNNQKDFIGSLTHFNLKEEELPELVANFFHEKDSWGEEFRKLSFPQPERQYTDQATQSDIAELAGRMGYWPPDSLLTTPIAFIDKIPEKYKTWELVSYQNFGTVNLIAEQYPNSNKASEEFKKKFEKIKEDNKNINANIGKVGENGFSYYREIIKYGSKSGESYTTIFRINNIILTITNGYGVENYINSKEKLITVVNEKYEWVCNKFQ